MEAKPTPMPTFGEFINQRYAPWARNHLPGDDVAGRLKADFSDWLKEPMVALSSSRIAAWRRDRLQSVALPGHVDQQLQALGICFGKAVEWRVIDANPVQELGSDKDNERLVELFTGGIGLACLREGWARLGVNWTWTLGKRAVIELRGVDHTCDHTLKVYINNIYRPTPSALQRINVAVNDTTVGMVVCRNPAIYEFYVPSNTLSERECVRISLELPDACRPMDFEESTDRRYLALRIVKLELTPRERIHQEGTGRSTAAGTAHALFEQRAALQDMVSLGHNCEFGFVQRCTGAEPMSLFRWSDAPAAKLIKALENRLAGLNARDALDVRLNEEGEFVTEDKVYGFRHHTFVSESDGATLERVTRNEYIRVGVLTKTLLEELRGQKKLFVYQDGGESTLSDVRGLVRALRNFGNNTLLWVVAAPDPSLVGVAEEIEPGLIKGHVSEFQRPPRNPRSPHLQSWLATVVAAHKIWTAKREAEAPVPNRPSTAMLNT